MLEVKFEVFLMSEDEKKQAVEAHAAKKWSGMKVASHGELFDLSKLPCLIAVSDGEVLGYCYYHFSGDTEIELIAMETIQRGRGAASLLIKAIISIAKKNGCRRLFLTVTNDNTEAMSFYQHKGFIMCGLRIGEVAASRKLKPGIPLVGYNEIPILHEVEFEMRF
ncbi:MAG: GNAT family N-acetyltransferase [Oscillospiraceae bacterium]|nr:GNAT family N-acetyltransferase [Oscillospiraceae bacterium]